MKNIWEFFDNLNEFVYVSDIDSYELIYMNKKVLKTYGFNTLDEAVGKKCCEVIGRRSSLCSACNNQDLIPGYFKEWRCYSFSLGRHMILKDTMIEQDGRRYRMEIAIDANNQTSGGDLLYSYESLEALVNEGLRVALKEPTPDKSIDIILEYIGKVLNGERTYIFEKNESGGSDNTYEWVSDGVRSEKDNQHNQPHEVYANWYRGFSGNKHIVISDLEDIREKDPLQYTNLKQKNVRSLVAVPLYDEGDIIGFYGVDNPSDMSLSYISNMLQIMGHFIVSSLKRRNLVRQLQDMSYHDQLTGLGNRHAMHDYIEHMTSGESIGVVYCDITGLKRVNDTEGHKAGDRLIIRACESLKRTLGDYSLFRIGGDELLALCAQISAPELNDKIRLLKEDLDKNSVVMAVGVVWHEDCAETSIDKMLMESERLMYEDKALYYRNNCIDRRR